MLRRGPAYERPTAMVRAKGKMRISTAVFTKEASQDPFDISLFSRGYYNLG